MRSLDRHIADQLGLVKARVEKDLMAFETVTGVTVGYKQTDGEETGTPAIIVFVSATGTCGTRSPSRWSSYLDGSWQPSSVAQGSCSIMYYNLRMVVSEDYIDNDCDGAVITFTWWMPPRHETNHEPDWNSGSMWIVTSHAPRRWTIQTLALKMAR